MLDKAAETGKKVAIAGKTLRKYFEIGLDLGYFTVQEDTLISVKEIRSMNDENVVIIVSGNQGEPLEAFEKMIRKHHKDIKIKDTDTVLNHFHSFTRNGSWHVPYDEPNRKSWRKSINC